MRRCLRRLCAVERAVDEVDVVIVGAGPAGLSAAIRLKQLAKKANVEDFRVVLLEKGSSVGAHTLSGACIETRALDELIPDWKEKGAPIAQKVTNDEFHILTKTSNFKVPFLPSYLHNHHNYIVQLGAVTKWLGEQAEAEGVEIFCGFAGAQPLFNEESGAVEGIQLNDVGINKQGEKLPTYEPGMVFKARQTVLAEGCRGSLTKIVENKFDLRRNCQLQTYGLGIKEVWEVAPENFHAGTVVHTFGWPLASSEGHSNTYGGTFAYHFGENMVALGMVIGLDYSNPHIRPYMELQKWKTHPMVRNLLKGGKPIFYGARTLSEGGLASLPKMTFPGGVLAGDCAGTLNLPKIKGTHPAMKSGMLAAESIWEELFSKGGKPSFGTELREHFGRFKNSWLHKELNEVRNVRQAFAINKWFGVAYTGVTALFTRGAEPWTLKHHHADHECLVPIDKATPIEYPKPDGEITFDLLTNHSRSGTAHNADQPAHLKLTKWEVAREHNLKLYGGPEGRYCPAQVYEFHEKEGGVRDLVINAQNCLHCKACDIKDPTQNITWCPPEGSGGPNYNAQM